MNEVLQALMTRRSIRSFTRQPVSPADRDAILQAASYAPSGSNHQCWRFTALEHPAALAQCNEAVWEGLRTLPTTPDDYPTLLAYQRRAMGHPTDSFFYDAPLLILFSNERGYANAMADCAAALENALLAAHGLGLGGCWINQPTWTCDQPAVRACLTAWGLPSTHAVCGAAAIGHPAGPPPQPAPRRQNIIHII